MLLWSIGTSMWAVDITYSTVWQRWLSKTQWHQCQNSDSNAHRTLHCVWSGIFNLEMTKRPELPSRSGALRSPGLLKDRSVFSNEFDLGGVNAPNQRAVRRMISIAVQNIKAPRHRKGLWVEVCNATAINSQIIQVAVARNREPGSWTRVLLDPTFMRTSESRGC